ncbi:DUF1269 domain-containing protein [Roseovarius sp. SCSIO 43702]|uniref:DUF1269 domain-containing protein n=1 Tax=Roseovarius sp. SCSIO 43702 TaxID=2823043 RepID=UPI001C730CD9|nr:DUF1269 domain-containing protein [Roseovarius sp. SCSIO 43702]QYX57215.1 DUF1269 domain-containing protein [Roseovarius sp. SCSIO 43702]
MSELLIVIFESPDGAERLDAALKPLRDEQRLETQDIVIAVRDADGELHLSTPANVPVAQTLGGIAWGAVLGAAFMMPVAGAIAGGAVGAVTGQLRDPGLDSAFTEEIGRTLRPGGSALCLWVRDMDEAALREVVESFDGGGRIVQSPLSPEDEARLQEALDRGG